MDDFATGYLAGQDGGNNNGGFFGNEGLWAVIILAIIFGWGTNGYGRNGGDNGMNSYIPYLVGTGATGQGGADTRAALSEGFYQQDTSRSLAGIQSGICSLGYDQLAQMNGVNTNIANGFAGVNSAICQLGYQNAQLVNGLERSVSNGDNAISLAIMQEGNARQAGQTALASQLASCCCENKQLIGDLKYTIAQQDCATRQANGVTHTLVVMLSVPTFKKSYKLFHFVNPPRNFPTQSFLLPLQPPERTRTVQSSFRAVWLHG